MYVCIFTVQVAARHMIRWFVVQPSMKSPQAPARPETPWAGFVRHDVEYEPPGPALRVWSAPAWSAEATDANALSTVATVRRVRRSLRMRPPSGRGAPRGRHPWCAAGD